MQTTHNSLLLSWAGPTLDMASIMFASCCLWILLCLTQLRASTCAVPGRVENLEVSKVTSSSISLRWLPPVKLNGKLKAYEVSFKTLSQSHFATVNVTHMQIYDLTRLHEETMYVIQVLAVTEAGKGLPVEVNATTLRIPKVSDVVTKIESRVLSWDTIEVSWAPIIKQQEVTSYIVRCCSTGEDVSCTVNTTTKSDMKIGSLSQLTRYRISVQGRNIRGTGPWSSKMLTDFTLDRDECKDGVDNCSKFASCKNTNGSFECTCLSMYTGDGITCKGLSVVSPEQYFCPAEEVQNIFWEQTAKGQTLIRGCPQGALGDASRKCKNVKNKASWDRPNLWSCRLPEFDKLKQTLAESSDAETTVNLLGDLERLTARHMFAGDIQIALDVLGTLPKISVTNHSQITQAKAMEISTAVVNITNNLLSGATKKVWMETQKASRVKGVTDLIKCLDDISLATAALMNTSLPFQVEMSSVVLVTQSFTNTNRTNKLSRPNSTTGATIVSLPLREMLNKDEPTQVSFIYFHQIGELLGSDYKSDELNVSRESEPAEEEIKRAVGPWVTSVSTSANNKTNFKEPIELILQNPKGEDLTNPSCVFWDTTRLLWSSDGCVAVRDSNSTRSVCRCFHLTSFSVLMQYMPATREMPDHHLSLSLITYIGIGTSLIALVIALITFCSFKFLSSTRNFAHVNLVLSMIMAEVLFVAGIDRTENQLGCTIIAAFLHYLFLVMFSWMAAEGVILYVMLVKILPSSGGGPRRRVLFLCSWGLPSVPVILALVFYRKGYGNQDYCWLSLDDGFIWFFIGPVLLVCLVNLVFLVLVFKSMAERKKMRPIEQVQPRRIRHWAKACAVLMCLLGTTWLLGLFFVNQQSVAMAYLFNIFNSLQGLFIFIFHCLADERIRKEYVRILCCRGTRREHMRKLIGKTSSNENLSTTARIYRKTLTSKGKSCVRDSAGAMYAEMTPIQVFDDHEDSSAPGSPAYEKHEISQEKNEKGAKEPIYGVKLPRNLDELAEKLVQLNDEEGSQIGSYGENWSGSLFCSSPGNKSLTPPPYQEFSPSFSRNPVQEAIRVTKIVPRNSSLKRRWESDSTLNSPRQVEENSDETFDEQAKRSSAQEIFLDVNDLRAPKDQDAHVSVAAVESRKVKLDESLSESTPAALENCTAALNDTEFSACKVFYIGGERLNDSSKDQDAPSRTKNAFLPRRARITRDVEDNAPTEQSRDTPEGAQGCDDPGNKNRRLNQSQSTNGAERSGKGKQQGNRPLGCLFRKPWVSSPQCFSRKHAKQQPDSVEYKRQQCTAVQLPAPQQEKTRSTTQPCSTYERRFPNVKVLYLKETPRSSIEEGIDRSAIASSDSCEDLDNNNGNLSSSDEGVKEESNDVRSLVLHFEAKSVWKKRP